MKISVSQDNVNFKPMVVNGLRSLEHLMTKYNYSFSVYKDSYRNAKNFIEAHAIGLDFDNDKPERQMSIDQAKRAFQNYKHIIAPSRSHGKLKNGKYKDRFRVVLFLDEPIRSARQYKDTYKELLQLFPQADPQCNDAARFFYPSPKIEETSADGQLVSPQTKHLEAVKEVSPISPTDLSKMPPGFTKCKWNIANGRFAQGERNWAMMALTTHLKSLGYTRDMATALCIEALSKREAMSGAGYDEAELEKTIISEVYDKDYQVNYNCQIEGTELNHYCQGLDEDGCSHEASPFEEYNHSDFMKRDIVYDWAVDHLFMRGATSLFAADAKSGKSTIMRQLVKSVATGKKFLGRACNIKNLLYFPMDENEGLFQHQLKLLDIPEEAPIKYVFYNRNKKDIVRKHLKSYIEKNGFDFVIVDTLKDIATLEDSNNYNEVYNHMSLFTDIARQTNCHILFITHTNKRGGTMGSTAFDAFTDTIMTLRVEEQTRKLSTKGRGLIPFHEQILLFDPETGAYDIARQGQIDFMED